MGQLKSVILCQQSRKLQYKILSYSAISFRDRLLLTDFMLYGRKAFIHDESGASGRRIGSNNYGMNLRHFISDIF